MNRYRIGRVTGPWINFTPPIRGGKFSPKAHNGSSNALETPSVHAEALSKFFHGEDSTSESEDSSSPTSPCTTLPKPGVEVLQLPPDEPNNAKVVKQALEDDIAQYPSLDATTQQAIVQKYRELHDRVKKEGFYECRYREYVKELVQYVSIFAVFIVALRAEWYMTSAALLGLFWVCPKARCPPKPEHAADRVQHQIMFTAHDAGHREISHNFVIDTLIGMFIADFCCGLSIGWWKSSHNVHHLVTNHHASLPSHPRIHYADNGTGARPGYPECPVVCNVAFVPEKLPL